MGNLLKLRQALEASWDEKTSYRAVKQDGNPSLGQCYPTSWLVQQYFPEMKIAKGKVWNGREEETHFWNVLDINGEKYHVDLTWRQFPHGSYVTSFNILDRNNLRDGQETVERCSTLQKRVEDKLRMIQ